MDFTLTKEHLTMKETARRPRRRYRGVTPGRPPSCRTGISSVSQ